ncbi:MAG: hypothetical protein RSD36_18475 [Terrisporobacter sp.]
MDKYNSSVNFGLVHYDQFSQYGILGILGTSNQILVGFLLGKMY